MPSTAPHLAPPTRAGAVLGPPRPRLSLSVETERGERTDTLIGGAARSLLCAAGVPSELALRLGDTATVAARYLAEHSGRSRYRLWIHTDSAGIALAVTDCLARSADGPLDWLPVSRPGRTEADSAPDPGPADGDGAYGLDLHRTPVGHLWLGCRAPWPAPGTPPSAP
ncbi:hypothetical protein ACFWXK_11860 [Streptomyces sp. NPDC059070]|uniref:hypothetical protein n=1 Tax=Streptomyces sp. NPDC059070 TaxID=3346713 RepID=UPI00368382A1